MNILFVVGRFPTFSQTFIVNQINDLIDQGHNVSLFSFFHGEVHMKDSYANRHKLIENCIYQFPKAIPLRVINKMKKLLTGNKHILNSRLIKIERSIDVVHCHFGNYAVLFEEIYLNKYFQKAYKVCTFHGYDFLPDKTDYYTHYYEKIISKFDLFTYNTPYFGQIVNQVISDSKTYELPVGFSEDFLEEYYNKRPLVLEDNVFSIIFCGRLISLKGVLFLPDIAKRLLDNGFSNFKFCVIGDGEESDKLITCIDSYGLNSYFEIEGSLMQEQVFEKMIRNHLLIMPGIEDELTKRAETQGLVVQEAQYLGLPVIVSDAGGLKHGMINNLTGIVVQQGDVIGFADQIIRLAKDKALYRQFSQNAHEYAMNNFSSRKLGIQLEELYRKSKKNELL